MRACGSTAQVILAGVVSCVLGCFPGGEIMERIRLMLAHPSILVMAAAVPLGIGLAAGGPAWVWLFVPLGVLAQMGNEYALHRFVFHLPPPRRQWAFDLLYQAHYGHHDFPTNRKLFFAPIWVTVPVLVGNFVLLFGVLATLGVVYALPIAAAVVLIGGTATFLGYEWFHMTAHLDVPKMRAERHVTRLHNQHHFRDFSKWFHVTPGGAIVDRVMGTAIDRESLKAQQRIEFIRTLGLRPDDPRLIAARERFAPRYGLSEDEVLRAARG
ncbi:sterol desaturase family protein [Aestuariibius sp. 2305UL40-4]|uniref:sterol desaturase family protein n=1 Tax=Aestuariibius violaceus TaxID=3234132 RepID=UPI00345E517F